MELTLQQWHDAMCRSGITVGGPDIAWMRSAMRIENTYLSVARLCGGARINGVLFLYVNPVDERTWKRVDLIVAKPLMDWARKHMDANAVSEKPKRVPLAKQQELF